MKIKFRRGSDEFTNEYRWTTVDDIYLTRPVLPAETPRKESMFLSDQKFVYGAKGAVRSAFHEGLLNIIKGMPEDKVTMQLRDIGAEINMNISNMLLDVSKKVTDSFFNNELKQPLTRKEAMDVIQAHAQYRPVERIRAYLIETEKNKPIAVIRIPSYAPPGGMEEVMNEVNFIASAIHEFNQYENVDTLIIDQGTNPGGYVSYVHLLLSMFASPDKPLVGQRIQYLLSELIFSDYLLSHSVDVKLRGKVPDKKERRKFLEELRRQMDDGNRLSTKFPFNFDTDYRTNQAFGVIRNKEGVPFWSKKLMVITDNQDASGGEAFPAVIYDSARGIISGDRGMGLQNPVSGHVDLLQKAEMNFRCPFAICERFNANQPYFESIGVPPHVNRTIRLDDLHNGLKRYAYDQYSVALAHSQGMSTKEIQVALNKRNALKRAKKIVKEDGRLANQGITSVVKEFRADVESFKEPVEENLNPWLAAYTQLFETLYDLEQAHQIPLDAWDLTAIPLPDELIKSDPVLMHSTRKDVVLRRFEEMLEGGLLDDRPNTKALVKSILMNAYKVQGFFHFGEPCELLFN